MTAVEFLVEQIKQNVHTSFEEFELLVNQAKEMEKQQIIDAVEETIYEMSLYESFRTLETGEQYYNETFKSE
jgi:hypothetical protein